MNHTHITLIHKVEQPSSHLKFRHVSLCNIPYKVVAKILAQILKPFLDTLVDDAQYAFLHVRNIMDNTVTDNELIHFLNLSDSLLGSFALKIDICKAYDRDSWRLLIQCLRIYGIVGEAHALIVYCIFISYFFVMVINGTPESTSKLREV